MKNCMQATHKTPANYSSETEGLLILKGTVWAGVAIIFLKVRRIFEKSQKSFGSSGLKTLGSSGLKTLGEKQHPEIRLNLQANHQSQVYPKP